MECVAQSDGFEKRSQISLLHKENKDDEGKYLHIHEHFYFKRIYLNNVFFVFFTEKSVTLRNYIITILLLLIVSIVVIAIYLYVRLKGNQQ